MHFIKNLNGRGSEVIAGEFDLYVWFTANHPKIHFSGPDRFFLLAGRNFLRLAYYYMFNSRWIPPAMFQRLTLFVP